MVPFPPILYKNPCEVRVARQSLQQRDRKREREREREMDASNVHEIVVVGGGIVGLATALALHRKGLKCLVLERSESLRAHGTTIGVHSNGWMALDQLGVGNTLREKAFMLQGIRDVHLTNQTTTFTPNNLVINGRKGEQRCVKRSDLVQSMADSLPLNTIRFSSRVVSVKMDPRTYHHHIHLDDGSIITAKMLIGCDGGNSMMAGTLGFNAPKVSPMVGLRGMTYYPNGHGFSREFLRIRHKDCFFGRTPVDEYMASWFLARPVLPTDSEMSKDPKAIMESTLERIKDFPEDIMGTATRSGFVDLVKNSDLDSVVYTVIRYRTPWEVLFGSYRRGTMTLAGDAMHVMGPFLQQGGSSGLEDAVALARSLAKEIKGGNPQLPSRPLVETAIDNYLKERRGRLLRLSTQSYIIGIMSLSTSITLQYALKLIMLILFGHSLSHTMFDCGRL